MQTGFEACILFSSIKSGIHKICAVSLLGKLYEFLCLCFGLGPAPKIFTKLLKIPVSVLRCLNILIMIYLDDMLLIGHTNVNSQRYSNLSSSTTRVCTEFKEISVDTCTENRVLRGDSRFIKHDPVSTIEESLKSSEAVSVTSSKNTNVDFRINKTNRLIAFNYSNSTSSKNKFQVPTTTANTSIKNTEAILQKGNSKQKLQGRTAVVDKKSKNLPWSLLDSVSQSSADTDRYIQKGMGCIMSRDIKRGAMVKGGQIVIDKCIRTESSKISTFDLQRTKIF